jgi:hypothetical protein
MRSTFRDHRKLLPILVVAVLAIVALVAVTMMIQRDDRASANETQAEGARASLGIDPTEGKCPKAEPEKLPPDALAGATEAALDQSPSVFGEVEATEGAYAVAAYLGKSGLGRSPMIRKGLGCSQLLQDRSVTVDLVFPELEPSASLSQHTVFVARFRGDYRVWGVGR